MRWKTRSLLTRLLLVGPLSLVVAGCGSSAEQTKTAIERVLKADKQLADEAKNLPPNATPSQVARRIGAYCDKLERLNKSDCPADFRVAYKHHLGAWREARDALGQLPDGFLGGLFLGVFNGLTRAEWDGGAGRLEGDLKGALQRVRTTWEEVEKVAAKYGVAL
jgi:hypothetical protein